MSYKLRHQVSNSKEQRNLSQTEVEVQVSKTRKKNFFIQIQQ
jgi:hypothetical protein